MKLIAHMVTIAIHLRAATAVGAEPLLSRLMQPPPDLFSPPWEPVPPDIDSTAPAC